MKYQNLVYCLLVFLIVSCGSSERVITEDGKVYEVKGNSITMNGEDVSESLTEERRVEIETVLNNKRSAEKEAEKLQKELDDKQRELEKAQKEAEKKQDEIEEKQKAIEEKIKAQEEAREDYLKAKKRLENKKEKYERLKSKGKLSPRDEEKWQEKLKDLEEDLMEAKQEMDNLNKQ